MQKFDGIVRLALVFTILGALTGALPAASAAPAPDAQLRIAESHFADFFDASGALSTIDSGIAPTFGGLGREVWQKKYDQSFAALNAALAEVTAEKLSTKNRRALEGIRSGIAWRSSSSLAPAGDCAAAGRHDASGRELRTALYACFSSVGDAIEFEGQRYSRMAALQMLEHLDDPARRRALFIAMGSLTSAINGDNTPDSPYRRMLVSEAQSARANIENAEASLGLAPGAGERWLEQALEAWRASSPSTAIEPWDFRYSNSKGARAVQECAHDVLAANYRFFNDLGANLERLQVMEDVADRAGMAPVDYTDLAQIGRYVSGKWRPAIPRVSVLMQGESLSEAGELTHENGHAVHFAAMRARPSLLLPDDLNLAVESFADITGWSVFNPVWQRKYLGCVSTETEGLRARLGGVILDIAWGLFESRMSRNPASDPNAVWTDITSRYLHIVSHPELSWWAVRGQLVDEPGYMITYALGSFVTADLRAHIRAQIGEFDAGNPRWYNYLAARLYRYGGELEPRVLLRQFLGRPITPEALLADIRKMNEGGAP
jgi:hypothetical protein